MDKRTPQVWAWVVVSGAFLLVIDLFLDWQKTTVNVAGVLTVNATSSAWGYGWGIAAGVLAIAVIVTVLARRAAWTLGLSFAMLVATAFAAFLGATNVFVPSVGVTVDTTLWPAWVGVGLAALTTAAAIVPFRGRLAAPPRGLKPHATA
jgi:xanthine/uracil permease